jgi:hypothetical protein
MLKRMTSFAHGARRPSMKDAGSYMNGPSKDKPNGQPRLVRGPT